MGIAKQLQTVDEAFAKIAAVSELANKPLIIGENDPEGCAACPGPQNAYRNGTMYSSYTAASYARIWELSRRRHAHLEGALTWAFTFVGQPWFAGYRQLATRDVDLPVLNVFRLFAHLGADQIEARSSRELPLNQIIADGVRDTPDVGVLATRAAGGRIDVLLWHYRDDDVSSPAADIKLRISDAGVRGAKIRAWRVDDTHANAFSVWKVMGSPPAPTSEQHRQLAYAAKMRPLRLNGLFQHGQLVLERVLPVQGVELIEIEAQP
jgi:xylan 1,4-beta-xylosidase